MQTSGIWIISTILILTYILQQLLNFYGIGPEYYAPYISFMLFLAISYLFLPQKVGNIEDSNVIQRNEIRHSI
jgi:hypothetical protein